jgi:hypothetical protein
MENSEKGSRTLPDLMDDLFDGSGVFRSANFEFRFNSTDDKIQFRAGNFANSNTGWTDVTTFFDITGTFNASTTYNNFDLLTLTNKDVYIVHGLSSGTTFADEAAVIASANTEKLVDVSEARDWASKTDGQVVSTDYSSKAYAVGGTGVDTTTGSAKDWAIKTSSTVGNTGEYSAKYWATSTSVTTVSSGIANINTVAAAIASVNTTAANISNVNTVAGISADVTTVANIDGNVTTVAGISADTTTVAGIAPNVTTVAGVATNVTTVSGIASNVTTVANNNTNVTTVATNVADVNTVAGEINNNNLQTVANDIAAVITLADDLNEATSEIDTVANSITNVDTVGNDIANVNSVATNIANVNTSATNIANVNTVAGISANVTTVAGISADVTTAATNNANITTVAGISGNVTTVAGISANVTTVANISADVTTAATNVTAFNNTYLGAQSSAPTLDPDGSALDLGDLYFDTSSNTMKVYSSSGWTNAGSSVNGTADRFTYTATAAQTTFTGSDDNTNTLAYDAGFLDVYMNGVKLVNGSDFTATSGTSIVLASGAALNDTLEIIAYGTFTLSNQSINDMTDVSTSGVADNNLLAYNSTNSRFEPIQDPDVRFVTAEQINLRSPVNTGKVLVLDVEQGDVIGVGDLEIYDDRTSGHGYIKRGDTSVQTIAADTVSITDHTAQNQRAAFSSTGLDVTGTVTADGLTVDGNVTFSSSDTSDQFIITNTDGGASTAPDLVLYRNSSSPAADDSIGVVEFRGEDSAGNSQTYANIIGSIVDPTSGSEDGKISFYTAAGGTTNSRFLDGTSGVCSLQHQGSTKLNTDASGVTVTGRINWSNDNVVNTFPGGTVLQGTGSGWNLRAHTSNSSSSAQVFGVMKSTQNPSGSASGSILSCLNNGEVNIGGSAGISGRTLNVTAPANSHTASFKGSTAGYATVEIVQTATSGARQLVMFRTTQGSGDLGSVTHDGTGVTYNTTSDRRLKDNIEPITDATDKLMSMKPVTHTWIADPEADAVHGFIAQEMQEIVPEAVSGDPDGEEMMSMDYGRITPVLVAALQEATNEIKALKQRVSELEAI